MTPTAVRLVRTAVVLLLLLVGSPARAAGTGGIEISPYPGLVDGKQVTAFHVEVPRRGSEQVQYTLRNTTNSPKTARLYAASAAPDGKGSYTIGDPGSSPYVDFSAGTVTLPGGAQERHTFQVSGEPTGDTLAALVVEVTNGAVTQRAATLVYLSRGPVVPLPTLLVLGAVLMILVVLATLWLVRRRRT